MLGAGDKKPNDAGGGRSPPYPATTVQSAS